MTLRQAQQAAIDKLNADMTAKAIELSNNDQTFASWMDEDLEVLKARMDAWTVEIAKHVA
jgi:hypothetical protein